MWFRYPYHFHKTILQEFYQVTFRKKLYADIDTLQKVRQREDIWLLGLIKHQFGSQLKLFDLDRHSKRSLIDLRSMFSIGILQD